MMPFSSRNTVLRMIVSALVGGYGLTFLTISALILLPMRPMSSA